jgi:hypothetical protein
MGNEETKLREKVDKMGMRLIESELDKKSLEPLGEYDVAIVGIGVFVMFKSRSLSLSDRKYNALIEFGRDNASLLSENLLNIWMDSYRVIAFYPNGDHAEGRVEGMEEKEKADKMEKRITNSDLDIESLEMLERRSVAIARTGVFVMFQSQLFNLNETEAKALIEFGQDNKSLLSGDFVVVLMHSYRVCAFYPNRDYTKGQVEGIGAEGKGE